MLNPRPQTSTSSFEPPTTKFETLNTKHQTPYHCPVHLENNFLSLQITPHYLIQLCEGETVNIPSKAVDMTLELILSGEGEGKVQWKRFVIAMCAQVKTTGLGFSIQSMGHKLCHCNTRTGV